MKLVLCHPRNWVHVTQVLPVTSGDVREPISLHQAVFLEINPSHHRAHTHTSWLKYSSATDALLRQAELSLVDTIKNREVLQNEIRMQIFVKLGLRPHESCDGPANRRVVLQIEN